MPEFIKSKPNEAYMAHRNYHSRLPNISLSHNSRKKAIEAIKVITASLVIIGIAYVAINALALIAKLLIIMAAIAAIGYMANRTFNGGKPCMPAMSGMFRSIRGVAGTMWDARGIDLSNQRTFEPAASSR